MTNQIETPAAPKASKRSQARAALATRIEDREKAKAAVQASEDAGRRLQEHGQRAAALAAKLEAERAADAERLAQHAISGEGEPPKLTDDSRVRLHAELIESQAQAAAAQPAIERIAARTAELNRAHHRTAMMVFPCLQPILLEEAMALSEEIRDLNAKLLPVQQRLMGLRQHIYNTAHSFGDDRRQTYLMFGGDLDGLIGALGINSQMSTGEFEGLWAAFSSGLTQNPDLERP